MSLVKNPIKVGEEFVLHGNVSPNSSGVGGEITIEVFDGFAPFNESVLQGDHGETDLEEGRQQDSISC